MRLPGIPRSRVTGMHNGGMADDDIERLIREVQATTSGTSGVQPSGSASPAKRSSEVESGGSGGGRFAFAVVAAGITGVGAFVFGVFTPWTDALDMGFAAGVAGFLTGIVAGPPRWFSS